MKNMVSGISSTSTGAARQIASLKKGQDEATARLASDTTGVLGVGDVDMTHFLTDTFKSMRMLQVKSGPQLYGTLGIIPDQQHAFDGVPYFRDGSVRAVDRAGSASFTSNIIRTGPAPDGYTRGKTILVQKRIARTFNPAIDRVSYIVEVREVPADYVLQPDERYDGDFSPANALGLGQDFTSVYPVDSSGQRLYNGNPLTPGGWDGTSATVVYNAETIPEPTALSTATFQLPDNFGSGAGLIYGRNISIFTSQILIGPYRAGFVDSSTNPAFFNWPVGMAPGVYDVIVVNNDGQVGLLSQYLTVLAEV